MIDVPLYRDIPRTQGSSRPQMNVKHAALFERCSYHHHHGRNAYRGTSLIRKRLHLGLYSKHMPRAVWWS